MNLMKIRARVEPGQITMTSLSICIPTYNRADAIAVTLRDLLQGLRDSDMEDSVEVCVSDNASADHTQQVIRKISSEFPLVRHTRNSINLGFGRNLWSVIKFAKSDFVLLMGDDDSVSVEAISQILSTLDNLKPDLLLLNSAPGHKAVKMSAIDQLPRRIADVDSYLTELGAFHATFIGNLAFKRQAFLEVPVGDFVTDSAYPHMVPVFICLERGAVYFSPVKMMLPTDTHREWRHMQPIYTAIDLAQIYAHFGFPILRSKFSNRARLAISLARSLPRSWYLAAFGEANLDGLNNFQSVSLKNILSIYLRLLFPKMQSSHEIGITGSEHNVFGKQ
jgi:glycosyltransferase involved in cell wall biosynthesis